MPMIEGALRSPREQGLEEQIAYIASRVPGLVYAYRSRPDGAACMPFTSSAVGEVFGIAGDVLAEDAAPWAANVHPDDLPPMEFGLVDAARTVSRWHGTYRYVHPTKGLRWIEGWAVPRAEPDGSTLWHGFALDVTDREGAERVLRATDERL